MSQTMIQKVLSHYHLPELTCIGLLLFMLVFTAALLWVYRKGSSEVYAKLGLLPLQDLKLQDLKLQDLSFKELNFKELKFQNSGGQDSHIQGKILEGHSHDGIDELDNALPNWWINSFYLTMLFAAVYFCYYTLGEGPTLLTEYERAKKDYEYSQSLQKGRVKVASEEELRAFLKDSTRIAAGRELYQGKCLSCHGAQGQGGIGPNLTDDYWIHGGKMTDILNTVTQGVLDKGMPPWGSILKQDEIYSVVTFVKSLRGTHPANAKAPQGDWVKE